jgi:hypothetical protein
MSATRDPSEKITFLFTPIGKLIQRIKETPLPEAPAARTSSTTQRSRVLKTGDAREAAQRPGLVREYRARDIRQVPAPEVPEAIPASLGGLLATTDFRLVQQREALSSLGKNLEQLQDLEKRLEFMLLELEDLLKA